MTSFGGGMSLAWSRLRTAPTAWGALGAAAFVVLAAIAERRAAPYGALDRTLTGAVFGITVPLVAFAAVRIVTRAARLDDSVEVLARHGLDRRGLVLGAVTVVGIGVGAFSAVLGWMAVGLGPSTGESALRELAPTGWVGVVTGAAYAVLLFAGATVGGSGWGRGAALLADWVLGTGTTLAAVPWPRAHARSLLGGERVADLGPWGTQAALAATIAVGLAFTLRRLRP